MTPMVDLFSLLLTFFMLTTSFRPQEAAPIETPNSVSEKQAPDNDIMTIFISKDGKVFLRDAGNKHHTEPEGAEYNGVPQIRFKKNEKGETECVRT